MTCSVEPLYTHLVEATPEHSRQSEASVIELRDGRLFLAWTDFTTSNWQDHGSARIMGKWSHDSGATWSDPVVLQENIGRLNVMIASLLQLPSGRILLCFHRKDVEGTECHLMVKWSDDNAQTWADPIQITYGHPNYWCGTNDRFIQLDTGRILLPAGDARGMTAFYSDDAGETWAYSKNWVRPPADDQYAEPVAVERADGTILMLIRSRSKYIRFAMSENGGESWQKSNLPDSSSPSSPYSPSNCKRVPGSGDLLLVWNNNGGHRIPLTAAISSDGGRSWDRLRDLEPFLHIPPAHTYAYPSIAFKGENVHITYWDTFKVSNDAREGQETEIQSGQGFGRRLFHLKYRRLPLSWFYEADATPQAADT